MRLHTLPDTHFEVNAVANDVYFHWFKVVEDISVVPISVANGILVLLKSFVKECLVIHIPFLYAEHSGKHVGLIDGVSRPRDVANVVFLALAHLEIDIHMLLVMVGNAVLEDNGVAVTQLVILRYKALLVLLVTLRRELLFLEYVLELVDFVQVLQRSL